MKINSAALTKAQEIPKLLHDKNISTLLELVKPLSQTKALVKLGDTSQVTLEVKQPLEKETLYHALLQKKGETLIAKELFKLPLSLKSLLKTSPLLDLPTLISRLFEGDAPKKIALDTLAQHLLVSTNKEETALLLDQLSQIVLSENTSLVYEYLGAKGYIRFKDQKREFSQNLLRFEAYFPLLGVLKGEVTLRDTIKRATLSVSSKRSKILLDEAKADLGFNIVIKIEEDLSLETPTNKILDIKG